MGIPESRSLDDDLRDVAVFLGVPTSNMSSGELIQKIAERKGISDPNRNSILILEAIGEKLAIPREKIYDQNSYYLTAEKYWVTQISRHFNIRTVKNDDELLDEIARRLGVIPSTEGNHQHETLVGIALKLGISENSDKAALISKIAQKVRAIPLGEREWLRIQKSY